MACPVTHLLALYDRAFAVEQLNEAANAMAVKLPDGQDELHISWRRDVGEVPLLQAAVCGQMSADTPLMAKQAAY